MTRVVILPLTHSKTATNPRLRYQYIQWILTGSPTEYPYYATLSPPRSQEISLQLTDRKRVSICWGIGLCGKILFQSPLAGPQSLNYQCGQNRPQLLHISAQRNDLPYQAAAG